MVRRAASTAAQAGGDADRFGTHDPATIGWMGRARRWRDVSGRVGAQEKGPAKTPIPSNWFKSTQTWTYCKGVKTQSRLSFAERTLDKILCFAREDKQVSDIRMPGTTDYMVHIVLFVNAVIRL